MFNVNMFRFWDTSDTLGFKKEKPSRFITLIHVYSRSVEHS